jgi:tyrosinase
MAVLSRPFFALTAIAALLTPSFAAPLENIQVRQADYVAVTGAAVGGVQPRLEIRDVEANKEMFNLLLLAMKRFQDTNQEEKLSYYEISG